MSRKWAEEDKGDRKLIASAAREAITSGLVRRDPLSVLEELGATSKKVRPALIRVIEQWFIGKLALPSSAKDPYFDDQGLNRLIFAIWPTLPIKTIAEDPEIIKTLLMRMDDYWHYAREHDGQPWQPGCLASKEGEA